LLGLIVNLCLQIVGALLINALLLVPAATAANLCRNLRQLFWFSVALCITCGIGGLLVSWEFSIGLQVHIGPGGTIVVLAVLFFILSMWISPLVRDRAFAGGRVD
jgi:zinc transport system permease protein